MSTATEHGYTPEEYLAFERKSADKHEYHDGRIISMAGGGSTHSLLAVNLASELRQHLKGRSCLVFNSDMKVWIGPERHFFYPDLSGLCGEPEYHDQMSDVLLNPSFVVEVLSPSTEAYDRGKKVAKYMALSSVIEIVLVNQDEVRVEKYTRLPDGIWSFATVAGMEAVVRLESVACEIPLRDFYEGVKLVPPTDPLIRRFFENERST